MRYAHKDPELREPVDRYVIPERRYRRLDRHLLRVAGTEREQFTTALGQAADGITPCELVILLEGGWRERRTAAWFIAVAHRV